MPICHACTLPVDAGNLYCPACGAALSTGAEPDATRPPPSGGAPPARAEKPVALEGRFMPGAVLAGRYRLVALLGRGGMGEVYRAEDTRLGQTVALKFLPDSVAREREVLERFFAEVRIGRQVSHPNVCRLYDLIEVDGHHCLSMEYVDGEDLSSLLARIGRLPADKIVDIARELCAGLSAAHDKGVIHRDLKPANVMIDGKGRARIADFGIAALADSIERADVAGTPAYMAPELLAGQPASVASDLYALGLVLYELCTGTRLYSGRSLAEIRRQQETSDPGQSARSLREIPDALARVIQRCLERDPDARPTSASAVMAALPGGDPLQAAMAAGETPSPAMVAAAGKVGELSPPMAWAILVCALLGLFLVALVSADSTRIGRFAPEKSPELLGQHARAMLASIGYPQGPVDTHAGYDIDLDFLDHVVASDASPQRWEHAATQRPGPLLFNYRESPRPLVARRTTLRPFGPSEAGRVTLEDPPATTPGMLDVVLDRRGNLVWLRAVPRFEESADAAGIDWAPVLAAAGLDPALLAEVPARFVAPVDNDRKIAWEGRFPDQPGIALHIEAAALGGRVVWFDLKGPWYQPPRELLAGAARAGVITILSFNVLVWVAIGIQVRRNLRLGRGDRQGAWRLMLFLSLSTLVAQWLRANHVASMFDEAGLILNQIAQVLLYAVVVWLMYIALEPIARRRWPHLLVGWSRLLSGRLRDPLVGRDLLIGCLGGIALALVVHLAIVLPGWLGFPPVAPRGQIITSLGDVRHLLYFVFWSPYAAVTVAFGTLFGLFIYRSILRNQWLALALLAISLYFGFALFTGIDQLWSIAAALFVATFLVVALRAGLLSAVVAFYVFQILEATPMTLDAGAWYFDRTLLTFGVVGALLVYGFWNSLAGRSPFGRVFLDNE